ncbi:MAG: alkaline phosphatase family protein [Acidothermus sp.]|nr:alkaline phosphatase family protein [Acidothermus sp.]MCL6537159.1 alkaline phosphatase family protein [Acidothermus sp.]
MPDPSLTAPRDLVEVSVAVPTLADVAAGVLASLGWERFPNRLGLCESRGACVLLVDGLGAEALAAHPEQAPFLHAALCRGRVLPAGFPSTTATSITSFGTACMAGVHGMVGYQMAVPGTALLLNALHWDTAVDPLAWQPLPTVFEMADAAGARAVAVAKREFRDSGLTRAALRGAEFVGADVFGEIVAALHRIFAESRTDPRRYLVYAYLSDLDWAGHGHGVGSPDWRWQLRFVDHLVAAIVEALPPGFRLYVTGDHGMVDVGERIDIESEPDLLADVRLVGGEARVRYLYTADGVSAAVAARWRDRLDGRAVVLLRDEAIERGWFGPVDDRVRPRIGDVVVALTDDSALVCAETRPREARLAGHHGSLTSAEQYVPLLEFSAE